MNTQSWGNKTSTGLTETFAKITEMTIAHPFHEATHFPVATGTTFPLKKDGFFNCLLKLHNLKIRE